jgi:SAM-dependent methyltransferase
MSDFSEVKDRMKFVWAQGHYAEVAKVLWPAAEAIVEASGIGPGMRVLDVAAGNGNVAVAAARKGASVVASDITPELVVQGRERTEAEGLDVEWREADAEELPFEDGSFDVVTSAFGAMFAPRADHTAGELIRVAEPGGKVAVTAWAPDGAVGRTLAISAKYMPPPPEGVDSPLSWGDEATVRARFANVASSVECVARSVPWRFASLEEDRVWAETNIPPIVVAKQLLPPETYEQFAADNLELLEELNTATDGSVAYDSEYLLTVATK